jgi:hypothetical protein
LGEGEPHRLQNDDLRRRVRLADAHGQLVGGGLVARVVDRDVRAGGGEFEGDDGAEAAVFVTQESIGPVFCSRRWGGGVGDGPGAGGDEDGAVGEGEWHR